MEPEGSRRGGKASARGTHLARSRRPSRARGNFAFVRLADLSRLMRGRVEGARRQPQRALHVAGAEVRREKKSDETGLEGDWGRRTRCGGLLERGCCRSSTVDPEGSASDTTLARRDVMSLARWSGDVEARTRSGRCYETPRRTRSSSAPKRVLYLAI